MSKVLLLITLMALLAPAAFAQQQPERNPTAEMMRRHQENLNREAQNNARDFHRADHQAWLKSMADLAKLRTKLAEAWQGMGMSPQGAKFVADAYDPQQAARIHHASLHGKSDQEVATMMQAALKEKRYLDANQLLIDYQRQKLRLNEMRSANSSQ